MGITFAIAFLPLLSFLLAGLGALTSNPSLKRKGHYFGLVTVGISLLLSLKLLFELQSTGEVLRESWFSWVISGALTAQFGGFVDSLTAVMLVVVNFVSFLVHLYSIGYMEHDPG